MIKFETNNGRTVTEVNGTLVDIMADTIVAIRAIYDTLAQDSKIDAMLFKNTITRQVKDGIPFVDLKNFKKPLTDKTE